MTQHRSGTAFLNEDSVPHHVMVGTDDLDSQPPGQGLSPAASTGGGYGY